MLTYLIFTVGIIKKADSPVTRAQRPPVATWSSSWSQCSQSAACNQQKTLRGALAEGAAEARAALGMGLACSHTSHGNEHCERAQYGTARAPTSGAAPPSGADPVTECSVVRAGTAPAASFTRTRAPRAAPAAPRGNHARPSPYYGTRSCMFVHTDTSALLQVLVLRN